MRKILTMLIAGAAVAITTAALAAPMALDITDNGKKMSGDPVHGKQVFAKCAICHSINPGQNMIGPSLHGVVGRKSGSAPGYNYSAANKNSGITWTEAELFKYLEHPMAVVPGTKMTFAGLPSAQDRADVIAYLKTNS